MEAQFLKITVTYPDKLEEENWSSWKRCMLNALDVQGLKDVVTEGFELTYTTATESTPAKLDQKSQTNLQSDKIAQNIIYTNISNSFHILLDNCLNSFEMWKALLNRFEGNDQMKRTVMMGLQQQFDNFRMNEGESVDDMFSRFTHIKNGFTNIGESLTNDRMVCRLLGALPANWEMMRMTLETQLATTSITLEDLRNHFRNFENRLKLTNTQRFSVAMKASNSSQDNKDDEDDMACLVRCCADLRTRLEDLTNRMRYFEERAKLMKLEYQPHAVALKSTKLKTDYRSRRRKISYCSKCDKIGHTIKKCYVLHPELSPWYKSESREYEESSDDCQKKRKSKRQKKNIQSAKIQDDSSNSSDGSDSDTSSKSDRSQALHAITDNQRKNKPYVDVAAVAIIDIDENAVKKKKEKKPAIWGDESDSSDTESDKDVAQTSSTAETSRDLVREVNYFDITLDSFDTYYDDIKTFSSRPQSNLTPLNNNSNPVVEQELERLRKELASTQQRLSDSEATSRSFEEKVNHLHLELENVSEKLKTIPHLELHIKCLRNENASLRSACARNGTESFSLDKILLGQKPSDKSGLGFKKEVGSHPASSRFKSNVKLNQRRGNAFIYRDTLNKSRTYKSDSNKHRTHQHTFFNSLNRAPHNNNNTYFNNNNTSLNHHSYYTQMINQAAEEKTSFKFIKFVKSTGKSYEPSRSCSFCNYCSNVGHISVCCPFKKPSIKSKFMWVRKDRDSSIKEDPSLN